ncbi:hypothetical protein [Agromyces silvae]|uniref:hypothetical protein n=1 Tax=Agromyces silvae TaxID=3388266 RepID=UPI00280B8D2D|nr:hypothetical protein [Agromyces protaetiae]
MFLLVTAVCWFTNDVWTGSPQVAGLPSHWIVNVTIVFLVALGVAWPFLLLPVSSLALVDSDGRMLAGKTALGRRRVEIASIRAVRVTLPGRGYSTFVLALRDRRFRVLLVLGTGRWHERPFEQVAGQIIEDRGGSYSAVGRYLAGVVLVLVSSGIGLLWIGALGAALGLWHT